MTIANWISIFGAVTVLSPLLLVLILGAPGLVRRSLSENLSVRLVQSATMLGCAASGLLLACMLGSGLTQVAIDVGDWVAIPHYHFHLRLLFDRLSIPFVILIFLLCGVISAFAARYLHREAGVHRFLMCYSIFVFGMVLAAVAGTIETLFVGWELVGLSSAFLIAFYQDRVGPLNNGFRVWTVYRISDAALLLASIVLHHLQGEGQLSLAFGNNWPAGQTTLTSAQCLGVGLLLLLAAAGKSALVPFSSWLPRAMEGPTPSSAIFYGALSVHLGAFLLLRSSALIEQSWILAVCVTLLGLTTAAYASLVGRAQTDVKSALSFASLTQVGLIVAEIGVGWQYLALVHLLGHASLRTLQFLRAPSAVQDRVGLENSLGRRLGPATTQVASRQSARQLAWYRWANERGYLDQWLDRGVVAPLMSLLHCCDRWERQWVGWLEGRPEVAGPMSARRPLELPPALEDLP